MADELIVTGNTFSGSAAGRAQALTNNAEGTDEVKLVVSNNIFKDITSAQQICYWNFNEETTEADFSENYYDIDVEANPNRFYFNGSSSDVTDLIAMGVYPYYADEAMTEKVEAPVAVIGGTCYYSMQDAIEAAQSGDTITLCVDATLTDAVELKDMVLTIEGTA